MEQRNQRKSRGSKTKIIPPKKKQSLSRDEVRSINKKKIKRKRIAKRLALLIALSIAIISVGVVLVLSVFFKVGTVTIQGDRVYSNKEIIIKSGVEIGDNLFRVDEEELNEKLTRELPYIEKISLERQLPDTVIINVIATREVAALQAGTGFVLVDHTGKVLDKDASMLREGVAVVNGITAKSIVEGEKIVLGNENETDKFLSLLKGIKDSKITLLTEINLAENGEFELRYDDRITIKVGDVNNISKKLQRAIAAIEKENEINAYADGVLDLRTDPYAYFSPGEETTVATTAPSETGENVTVTENAQASATEGSEGNSPDNTENDNN